MAALRRRLGVPVVVGVGEADDNVAAFVAGVDDAVGLCASETESCKQNRDCSWVHASYWMRTASRSGLVGMVADGAVRGQVQAERRMKARISTSIPMERA